MAGLKLTFLGSPQVVRNGKLLDIGSSKALALLVYLAVNGRNHSRDTLSTLLWPDHDQSRARTYLRHALWSLKKDMGEEWLHISREQIGFQTNDDVWLDVAVYREKVTAVSTHDHTPGQLCPDCLAQLQEAVSLYRDNFLIGFTLTDSPAFDEWQFFQAEELRQSFASALERLVQEYESKHDYEPAIFYARRWLSLDPLHEPAHRTLMRLYALDGKQAAALRQYQECLRLLDEELGVDPETETADLYETIRTRQLEPTPESETPKAKGQEHLASSLLLPAQPIPFVGRKPERDDLKRSLQNPVCRLLTITGPGGIGKTRLALTLAESSQPLFPDGVYFVSLAPLQSPEDIVTVLGNTLRLHFDSEGDLQAQLLRHLRQKHLLVVLDNFEHLLPGANLVAAILEAAPLIKIVATSRERLVLSSEVVYPLAGLRFPEQGQAADIEVQSYSAVQLLLQRATAVRPNLELDTQSLYEVVRICQMVEGMPLALVLAASWMDLLSFREVADEIERGLDFLATEMSDVPDRQRSMRAVFDVSWNNLTAEEQQALMILNVFHGGFVREAAQAVTRSGPRILQKLVNKSLLFVDENGRFEMHELLRQYILENSQASPALTQQAKSQHASYYASLLANLDDLLQGEQQQEALATLAAEQENVRAAWYWLIQQKQWETVIYRILPALFRYCELRFKAVYMWQLVEEAEKSLLACEKKDEDHYLFALLTVKSAFFYTGVTHRLKVDNETKIGDRETVSAAWQLRESATGRQLWRWQILLAFFYGQLINPEEGITTLLDLLQNLRKENHPWEIGVALQNLAQLYLLTEAQQAESYLTEALDIFQRVDDSYESGITLYLFGFMYLSQQQLTKAETYFLLAQQNFSHDEDSAIFAIINWELADVYVSQGKSAEAIECLRQSYRIFMARGIVRSALSFLSRESYESLRYGTIEHALEAREESLQIAAEGEDPLGEAWYIWEMGEIYRVMGDLTQARQWYERAFATFKKIQHRYDATFYHQGLAFYYRGLGNIALTQNKVDEAHELLQKSLEMAYTSGHQWITAYIFADLGRTTLLLGQHDLARHYMIRALMQAKQISNGGMAMVALAGVTMFYYSEEKWKQANELGHFVLNHPLTWQETKSQVATLLDNKVSISNGQSAERSENGWVWLDVVEKQIAILESESVDTAV